MSMSAKTLTDSSTSMASARSKTPKTQAMQSQHANDMTHEPPVVSDGSRSDLDDALANPAFQLAWDNDMRFQVSRHLVRLRMLRRMSQARLAKKIGTSQSAIARIESGEENFTASTVERMIDALGGRLRVSIAPKEFPAAPPVLWWKEAVSSAAAHWTMRRVELRQTADEQHVRLTFGREFRRNTLPPAGTILEAKVS